MRDFRRLEVWKQSMELVNLVYDLIDTFPKNEQFAISQQMQRCSVSIPSNIAEGCSRKSDKEFSRFIQISMGSSFELETQLLIASKRNYFNDKHIFKLLNVLQKRLNALNQKLITND